MAIVVVVLILYFFLGMVADLLSMILITIPVFYPVICGTLGYDGVWFGIVVLLILTVGGLTPPVGLYVLSLRGV
jgi:TRAP-type C4-dicarboxylate transport system permease large subunit